MITSDFSDTVRPGWSGPNNGDKNGAGDSLDGTQDQFLDAAACAATFCAETYADTLKVEPHVICSTEPPGIPVAVWPPTTARSSTIVDYIDPRPFTRPSARNCLIINLPYGQPVDPTAAGIETEPELTGTERHDQLQARFLHTTNGGTSLETMKEAQKANSATSLDVTQSAAHDAPYGQNTPLGPAPFAPYRIPTPFGRTTAQWSPTRRPITPRLSDLLIESPNRPLSQIERPAMSANVLSPALERDWGKLNSLSPALEREGCRLINEEGHLEPIFDVISDFESRSSIVLCHATHHSNVTRNYSTQFAITCHERTTMATILAQEALSTMCRLRGGGFGYAAANNNRNGKASRRGEGEVEPLNVEARSLMTWSWSTQWLPLLRPQVTQDSMVRFTLAAQAVELKGCGEPEANPNTKASWRARTPRESWRSARRAVVSTTLSDPASFDQLSEVGIRAVGSLLQQHEMLTVEQAESYTEDLVARKRITAESQAGRPSGPPVWWLDAIVSCLARQDVRSMPTQQIRDHLWSCHMCRLGWDFCEAWLSLELPQQPS